MKKYLLILCGFVYVCINAQCPSTGITITTQSELNAFAVNYPNCTAPQEYIQLYGTNVDPIVDFTPFENITSMASLVLNSIQTSNLEGLNELNYVHTLVLYENPNLMNLQGLENLQNVFSLIVYGNENLSSFTGLRSDFNVNYEISIEANPLLSSVSGLRNSPQPNYMYLSIIDNSSLISLDGLQDLMHLYDATVKNNDALTSLNGLNNIEYANFFEISENDGLTSLQGLESLINVGDQDDGDFIIKNNQQLESINGLDSFQGAHALTLNGNTLLNSIEGFSALQVVLTDFTIEENNSLTNLNGLENLEYVRTFKILNNHSLLSTQGLQSLGSAQTFEIEGNESLISLTGIENLGSTMSLRIRNNASLTELPEINVNNDYWFLTISNNPNLISLSNLESINTIKGVLLINNPLLASLEGLGSIDPATLTQLNLKDNSQLENCHLPNICTYLAENNGQSTTIENNFGNCTTIQDVYAACGIEMSTQDQIEEETLIYTQNNSIFIQSPVEIKNLAIYNLSGKMILQKNEMNTKEWEQTLFSKGTYIVKIIQTNGKTVTQKVLL